MTGSLMSRIDEKQQFFERLVTLADTASKRFGGDCPQWLLEKKRYALEKFKAKGLPERSQEAWKYTSLRALYGHDFVIPIKGSKTIQSKAEGKLRGDSTPGTVTSNFDDNAAMIGIAPINKSLSGDDPTKKILEAKRSDCCNVIFINGELSLDHSDDISIVPGLHISSLNDRLQADEHPAADFVSSLDIEQMNVLGLMNFAMMNDSVLFSIKEKTKINSPIHMLHISVAQGTPTIHSSRVELLVGAQSEVQFLESHITLDSPEMVWQNPCVDVRVDPSAKFGYHRFVSGPKNVAHTGQTNISLRSNAQLDSLSVTRGGTLVRHDLDIHILESGAEAKLWGLYLNRDQEHCDHHTVVRHLVPDTNSEQLYKGVLAGDSRAIFNGCVKVAHGAQRTAALQSNRNLLLGENAEIDTKPELEIDNDDVKCSHGATIGRLDDDQLFYIMSRGIEAERARAILSRAFAEDVCKRIEAPQSISLMDLIINQYFDKV
jgi:Fe-S cluster assembly protein SufD